MKKMNIILSAVSVLVIVSTNAVAATKWCTGGTVNAVMTPTTLAKEKACANVCDSAWCTAFGHGEFTGKTKLGKTRRPGALYDPPVHDVECECSYRY